VTIIDTTTTIIDTICRYSNFQTRGGLLELPFEFLAMGSWVLSFGHLRSAVSAVNTITLRIPTECLIGIFASFTNPTESTEAIAVDSFYSLISPCSLCSPCLTLLSLLTLLTIIGMVECGPESRGALCTD
jgi:hypothetical protein